jgi:hypothetical protein
MGSSIYWKHDHNEWSTITFILVKRSLSFLNSWNKSLCIQSMLLDVICYFRDPKMLTAITGISIKVPRRGENSKYWLRKWLLWAPFLFIHVFLILLINKRWNISILPTKLTSLWGVTLMCHKNCGDGGGIKSLQKLLASWVAQLWRHLLFLYILKDVCEEQGNCISTFLIELFLIQGGGTTGKNCNSMVWCRRTA